MAFRIGLKLWSTNTNYITDAVRLYENKVYNYIELYSVPDSFNEYIKYWEKIKVPYVIHAPHFYGGMNLSLKEDEKNNRRLSEEAFRFSDTLKSEIVIFHSGVNGTLDETVRQLKALNDDRIVIENKPFLGLNDELCVGHSPKEIKMILDNVGCGFCLDFGHAICAATAQKIEQINFIKEFIELNPKIYHLTDGEFTGVYDRHYHYGQGNFPLEEILSLITDESMITNEAKKDSNINLDDFEKDIIYIKNIL